MAQLLASTGLSKTITGQTVVLSWTKATDYLATNPFSYKFVKKGDPGVIFIPTPSETGVPIDGGTSCSVTLTFADAPTANSYANYIAEVQTLPGTGSTDTASAWCLERFWVVGPTLTVTIGSSQYTLTKDTFSSGSIYKLPASEANPITILYTDLQNFVASLPGGLTLPSKYPNGSDIGASLNIYEFIIDTGNALFSLSISVVLDWDIIPGLSINRLGLALKRTDGSL